MNKTNWLVMRIKAYYHAFRICFCFEVVWKDIKIKYYEFINTKNKILIAYYENLEKEYRDKMSKFFLEE
jgi:hypothetical protein